MKITSISIEETKSYEKKEWGEYKGRVTVGNEYAHNASINISLSPDQMALLVPIIAQAVAQNMADATNQFNESVQAALVGPPIEQAAISAPLSDDIPF